MRDKTLFFCIESVLGYFSDQMWGKATSRQSIPPIAYPPRPVRVSLTLESFSTMFSICFHIFCRRTKKRGGGTILVEVLKRSYDTSNLPEQIVPLAASRELDLPSYTPSHDALLLNAGVLRGKCVVKQCHSILDQNGKEVRRVVGGGEKVELQEYLQASAHHYFVKREIVRRHFLPYSWF